MKNNKPRRTNKFIEYYTKPNRVKRARQNGTRTKMARSLVKRLTAQGW